MTWSCGILDMIVETVQRIEPDELSTYCEVVGIITKLCSSRINAIVSPVEYQRESGMGMKRCERVLFDRITKGEVLNSWREVYPRDAWRRDSVNLTSNHCTVTSTLRHGPTTTSLIID